MLKLANGKVGFKSQESEELRIQGFKKEFKIKLNKIVNNLVDVKNKYNSDIHQLTGGHWLG